jgi:hypothetical protein
MYDPEHFISIKSENGFEIFSDTCQLLCGRGYIYFLYDPDSIQIITAPKMFYYKDSINNIAPSTDGNYLTYFHLYSH